MAFDAQNISRLLPAQSATAYYFHAMSQLHLAEPIANNDIPFQAKQVIVRTLASFFAVQYFSGSGAVYNLGSATFETGRALLARRVPVAVPAQADGAAQIAADQAPVNTMDIFKKAASHAIAGCFDLAIFFLSQFIITALLMSMIYAAFPQQTADIINQGLQWTSGATDTRIDAWGQPPGHRLGGGEAPVDGAQDAAANAGEPQRDA